MEQQEQRSSSNLPSELFLSLILCDSSFPGGSLANSNGLESAILNNLVIKNDRDSLMKYIDMYIEQVILLLYNNNIIVYIWIISYYIYVLLIITSI